MPNSIDKLVSALPFVKSLFGDKQIQKINSHFEIFSDASITKDKKVMINRS